ncbi:twin-arginine translocation signal domain-containing protein [Corynebacterium canis]|uniref:Twin-arginine translocation signal domain-containing protein n=1 Tax=Corynebacterium canis TaxID=679663 RepID=A0A5C5UEI9_9CORY|nr:ABC transporter substrate-binding protein [Corynebacterium canis]TWT24486.1 twin-arginine translocation signal domain-containing protein [Corynebacterium canis]WJY74342.1 putative D,D-dipeptide-binding periplasmic protein DdpA precursor [Corynebacterium canis]
MDRRQFLKTAAMGAAGSVLVSCGLDASNTGSATQPSPSKAGLLRIAAAGSADDALDPKTATGVAAWTAIHAIFESLVITGPNGPIMQLAKRIEHNEEADIWTVVLRDNAKYSNGGTVVAQDVVDSLEYLSEGEIAKSILAPIDFEKSKAFDETTAVLRLRESRFDFVESVLAILSPVFQGGNPAGGIGSGPYVLDSGNGAEGWVLKANQHYPPAWRLSSGLEVRAIADAGKRLRALNEGDVDLALDLPAGASQGFSADAEAWSFGPSDTKNLCFVMNVNAAPFDKEEVRRAMKLVVDREKLAGVIFDGHGKAGNDLPGQGLEGFPRGLRIKRDVDTAKELFAAAGVKTLTLITAELSPGMNDAAFLLVDQLKEVGVELTVKEQDPGTYLADLDALQQEPFFAIALPNLRVKYALPLYGGRSGIFNLSGWGGDEDWSGELEKLTGDKGRRSDLDTLGETFAEHGGLVLWGVREPVHGRAKGSPNVIMALGAPIISAVS